MGWVHRLSNIDTENRVATCSYCGLVPIIFKKHGNRWRCKRAAQQWSKPGVKRTLEPPAEKCDICSGTYMISWDHDHATGAHRGWLCMHCNTALGLAKDSPAILQKMINYLTQ